MSEWNLRRVMVETRRIPADSPAAVTITGPADSDDPMVIIKDEAVFQVAGRQQSPGERQRSPALDIFYGPTRVREVYYDEQGRPWTYSDARLLDKLRLIRDWLSTPVLRFPEDFDGEPEWVNDLQKMVADEKERL